MSRALSKRSSAAWIADQKEREICHSLVAIAAHLKGRSIFLKFDTADGTPRTDGRTIWIPSDIDDKKIIVKHELAHILFDSSLEKRKAFVDIVLEEFEFELSTKLPYYLINRLQNDLSFLVNVFEDVRVDSLWGLIYEGDGRRMREWRRDVIGPKVLEKTLKEEGEDISNLFSFLILVSLGQGVKSTKWENFRPIIEDTMARMRFQSFDGGLMVMRDLIKQLLRQMEITNTSVEEAESGRSPRKVAEGGYDFDKHTTRVSPADRSAVEEIWNQVDGEEEQRKKAMKMAEDISSKKIEMGSEETTLSKALSARVLRIPVKAGHLLPTELSPRDRRTARRLRKYFEQVQQSSRYRLSHEGEEIVVREYLQQRLRREALPHWRRSQIARGFRATLLVDLSGSMEPLFNAVERTTWLLNEAMNLRGVEIDVVGFQCLKQGDVSLYYYPKRPCGLKTGHVFPQGGTPLPFAIDGLDLRGHREEHHLFVITDGLPMFRNHQGLWLNRSYLVNLTDRVVKNLRRRGVQVWCAMIGKGLGEDLSTMFGHRRWREVSKENLEEDLRGFILNTFTAYLRRS